MSQIDDPVRCLDAVGIKKVINSLVSQDAIRIFCYAKGGLRYSSITALGILGH